MNKELELLRNKEEFKKFMDESEKLDDNEKVVLASVVSDDALNESNIEISRDINSLLRIIMLYITNPDNKFDLKKVYESSYNSMNRITKSQEKIVKFLQDKTDELKDKLSKAMAKFDEECTENPAHLEKYAEEISPIEKECTLYNSNLTAELVNLNVYKKTRTQLFAKEKCIRPILYMSQGIRIMLGLMNLYLKQGFIKIEGFEQSEEIEALVKKICDSPMIMNGFDKDHEMTADDIKSMWKSVANTDAQIWKKRGVGMIDELYSRVDKLIEKYNISLVVPTEGLSDEEAESLIIGTKIKNLGDELHRRSKALKKFDPELAEDINVMVEANRMYSNGMDKIVKGIDINAFEDLRPNRLEKVYKEVITNCAKGSFSDPEIQEKYGMLYCKNLVAWVVFSTIIVEKIKLVIYMM